ncbi:hypothetical protein [Streptomyces tirandamycinicus]|nr:hypothetical protein [Streptomyces tirandamycinicus]
MAYVLVLLAVIAALAVGVSTSPSADRSARSAGASGSVKSS